MSEFASALSTTTSALRLQANRIRMISENLANTDTPGYRRKIAPVRLAQDGATVSLGPVQLDQTVLEQVFDPSHPLADGTGHYDGSNVNLMIEIADAREAQRSYEANLAVMRKVRAMGDATMRIGR